MKSRSKNVEVSYVGSDGQRHYAEILESRLWTDGTYYRMRRPNYDPDEGTWGRFQPEDDARYYRTGRPFPSER